MHRLQLFMTPLPGPLYSSAAAAGGDIPEPLPAALDCSHTSGLVAGSPRLSPPQLLPWLCTV